jgi:hypothetical protein
VVFQGKVQRFLTIRCAIDELDADSASKSAQLMNSLIGLVGTVVTGGAAKAVLGGLPTLISAFMGLNTDDQILVLNHSLYTPSVTSAKSRMLLSGEYKFEKKASRNDAAQVTIGLEVMRVAK